MVNVYTDSEQVKFWAAEAEKKLNTPLIFADSWEQWKQLPGKKIAITELLWFGEDVEQRAMELYNHSDLLVLFLPEFVSDSLIRKMDLPGVVMFIGGVLNYELKHAEIFLCPYFFWSTVDFYRACPDVLNQLTHGADADRYFDVLLGTKKIHRDYVYQKINHDINIVKYFDHTGDRDIRDYQKTQFEWPTEVLALPSDTIDSTAQAVTVNGTIVSLSQIIPVNIYNQTHYTWVTESQCDDDWSFFTEKIVKPMLGGRLFLVTSGQHYLRNLRSLGFKTFGDVVDESYDSYDYWEDRLAGAVKCYNELIKQDPAVIRNKIAAVVDHNFDLITNTAWQDRMVDSLECVLKVFVH